MFALFPSRAVAVTLFGFSVHWYGVLYVCAFLLAWFLLPRLSRYRSLALTADDWSSLLTYCILGVLVGGRLGYVLFYAPSLFIASPLSVFAVWQGGMSSHGGFIGVGIALLLFTRRYRVPLLPLLDVIVVPAAIGLACGRIGNFINLELYGISTTLPWGIAIPGVEGLRHPTQIYAVIKDLSIAAICFWHLSHSSRNVGITFGLFLILYAILRFLLEFLRVQDYPPVSFIWFSLTRGQLLTFPLLLVGIGVIVWVSHQNAGSTNE